LVTILQDKRVVFKLLSVRKNRTVTEDAGNVYHLLEDKHPFFWCILCDFAMCFSVNVGNSLFNIVNHFLQNLWVIRLNIFFEKSSQREVWPGMFMRSQWPKATPNT